ncbi:MAG: DUF58 domain-containing protein [Planctomycetota bacterium]|nr:DUF58 domain-containing protein [Planctomycetota bacterium]
MPPQQRQVYKLDEILSPHAKEALSHLELFARQAVQGWMHGAHVSRRLGVSTEFDHHKLYQAGDPIKSIDWKASARHDRFYIKRSIEDSAVAVRLIVDRSASMAFAGPDVDSKYLQAARLAACLAYLITGHGDSVSLATATAGETLWLPAGSTQRHLVQILTALASSEPLSQDGLQNCLRTLVERAERRGIVAVISDLMFYPAPVRREMARLRAQGHEVILFQPQNPTEHDFPFNRWVQFGDLENASARTRVDTVLLKRIYREELQNLQEAWVAWARRFDVHLVPFRTDEHVDTVLSAYAAFRAGHGRGGK